MAMGGQGLKPLPSQAVGWLVSRAAGTVGALMWHAGVGDIPEGQHRLTCCSTCISVMCASSF